MIKSIQIKNFKSVVDLSFELGTFNVLIGENGCGKSNIIEAVAFGAAASADKLDYEFLGSRGIRATNPEFMFSAFSNGKKKKSITIDFTSNKRSFSFDLVNETNNPKKWTNKNKEIAQKEMDRLIEGLKEKVKTIINDEKNQLTKISGNLKEVKKEKKYSLQEIMNVYSSSLEELFFNSDIANYILFSPEESSLRKFEETTQIYPLGIKGEGLFQYLKELASDKKNEKTLNEIKHNLILLDWYEDFDLPDNLMTNEFALKIKDKYLYKNLQYFDQRSTNEGFLFLLFYSTLFISKTTPKFFAIDNIDASFNPKLCIQLTNNLASLAKKHKKQVIVTTHNPAILDGLNLKDDSQRLFVISRNSDGHTRAERINFNENRTMKLSEVWTKGFIGGLPSNF